MTQATMERGAKVAPKVIRQRQPADRRQENRAFGSFVAQQAAPAPMQALKPVLQPQARPVLREQHGRKEYTQGTIGWRIWQAAMALQAITPNTPVTAEAVRIALPDVNPKSISAGLSHWREFEGTLHTKQAAVA